jgi:hypothetical protein
MPACPCRTLGIDLLLKGGEPTFTFRLANGPEWSMGTSCRGVSAALARSTIPSARTICTDRTQFGSRAMGTTPGGTIPAIS